MFHYCNISAEDVQQQCIAVCSWFRTKELERAKTESLVVLFMLFLTGQNVSMLIHGG